MTDRVPPETEALSDRALGDLLSVAVLPAIWLDVTPQELAGSLAEALLSALDLHFVHIGLQRGDPSADLLRTHRRESDDGSLSTVRTALERLSTFELNEPTPTIKSPLGDGELRLARLRIACSGQDWLLTAASDRVGFPSSEERVLLSLSANQAGLVLQRNLAMVALRDAKQQALAANRAKDAFLANVSHEIRTPMNAILGMTELVLDSELTAEQRRLLSTAKVAADRLLVLVEGLLDFSKIEAGKVELGSQNFALRHELTSALETLWLRANHKGLTLTSHVAADVPDEYVGDAGRLGQILMNLVDNAIKFTDSGSVEVEVTLAERALAETEVVLRFSINDSGIGISPSHQARIFEAFAQVDASTTRKHGGAGLGLTIAARLVALLGGTIGVESVLGRGSQFRFTAQLTRGTLAQVAVPRRNEKREARARPLKILVAEDNEFNTQVLELMLERRGHMPSLCRTGDEALRLSEAYPFDLLLLDLHMPVLDGFQVIERIRARERTTGGHLPAIALTARSRPEDRERCLAAGMDDFLSKPLRADALWEAIERAVAPPKS